MADRRDIYADVTNSIIEALEAGVRPWAPTWRAGANASRPLRSNGVPYRGINVVALWMAAAAGGYGSPYWMTFRQAQEHGAHVRRGERATMVVYASRFTKAEAGEDGEITEREIPFLRGYAVFNADQIEGLPAHFHPQPVTGADEGRHARAETFIRNTGAVIRHEGDQPLYSYTHDVILCPPVRAFDCALSYYETITHEVVHWTGHERRLARRGTRRPSISEYAFEELIAEMGAAFLCADLALSPKPREDHAAYIAEWLEALRNDKRMIFAAATKAQQAVDFLHELQPGTTGT